MSGTTKTPNYNLLKPIVGADNDLWGDHINSDMDTLDTILKTVENKAGVVSFNGRNNVVSLTNADVVTVLPGSVTAPLINGTATAGVATTWSKGDHVHPTDTTRAAASAVPSPSATNPTMDGTAAPGVAVAYSRGDHVHPTDTSRYAATNPAGYQTAAQVTTALTPYALLNSPALTGNPTAPNPPSGDADTSVATTAFVAGAIPGVSYCDNGGFAVNQRGYTTGTALAAGAFGHDRWKGGASGCTYTFTASPPATTITITAGTLQQVVEGAAIIGGTYTLSWTGTAQGRVGAGGYAASPVTASGIVASANTTIEFNAGTLGRVKLEAGSAATPWVAVPPQQDLAKAQRFYLVGNYSLYQYATGAFIYGAFRPFPTSMRATPTVAMNSTTQTNCTPAVANVGSDGFMPQITAAAAGQCYLIGVFTASADL